jgi:AGZA family xanthine/uracil permease-like MFS transporter
MGLKSWINTFFEIEKKGSSIQLEILAGASTFLSLSYIFIVNPAILSQAGMDKSSVLFATIIASAAATITMGLWAKLPFALAPGMEINAFIAFFVVESLEFNWQQALGAVFWSGVIFVILTAIRVRERIIDAIPQSMKPSISLSVGVFLCLVALKVAGLVVYNGRFEGFGNLVSRSSLALYIGLALILLVESLKACGSILLSIILTSLIYHLSGGGSETEHPAQLSVTMFESVGRLDLGVILNPKMYGVILVLFLVDFYGSVAKLIGLTMNTNLFVSGKLPKLREALLIDGGASILGSTLGTSSIVVYVESAVGIGSGGRTGLTAVVCGVMMLACFLVTPFLGWIPVVATTGALVFVAIKLCPSLEELRRFSKIDLLVLIVMQVIVIITFAIDRALLAGFSIYLIADVIGRRRPNPYLVCSTVLLAICSLLQLR